MRIIDTFSTLANLTADDLIDGQKVELEVELEVELGLGKNRKVTFIVWKREDGSARLSTNAPVAYCQTGSGRKGKIWPCCLDVHVMSSAERANDAQYPARRSIPTWNLYKTTSRLNRQYVICGWLDTAIGYCGEKAVSQHNSAV